MQPNGSFDDAFTISEKGKLRNQNFRCKGDQEDFSFQKRKNPSYGKG